MEKKNYKFQNQFPNNNQENEMNKENRIKSLYTTIIKTNKKNYTNMNEYNKSSSREQKHKKINNIEKDERKNSILKTSYIKTEGNENENSPIHIKSINTASNSETPKSNNKILNVKVQETGNFNSNKNIKNINNINNINSNRNLRHSTSLSSSKINEKMKINLYSGNKYNSVNNKNYRNDSNNKLFNSCINFNSSFKNKKDKHFSNKILNKNKQKIKINNESKKHKSEIKSFSISQNNKNINNMSEKASNSLSKKNIRNKTSNSSISNNGNYNYHNENYIRKSDRNVSLRKENKSLNKIHSPNIHHYNYTTLSSRIKSSISTLSSTNSSSSLNKYKCPIVSLTAIKQKFFSSSNNNNIDNINNNNEIVNNNNFNKSNNNNHNNLGNYLLTDISSNSKKKKINNYSVITLIIISNWGDLNKVGITEIQLFDNKKRKIPISEVHVFNGNEENISRIHNNKYHTLNDRDMWISSYDSKSDKKIKIEMYILNNKYNSIDKIDYIQIWNYNGRELNKGIKEIEIMKKNIKCWKGIIPKGEYNIKNDYSFKIQLNEKDINMSDTLTNNSYHKRNFYLSLLKQNKFTTKLSFSQSDFNDSKNQITSHRYEKYHITFHKIRIQLLSNYGHHFFIGLTGINLIDKDDNIINIEDANSIGALPKDLRTIYNNENDYRVFENTFSNINNTIDENCMWLTVKNPKPFLEIVFENEMNLSRIDFWNYNEPFSLDKGVKEFEIIIDDEKIYNVIVWKGLGIDYYNIYQKINFYDLDFRKEKKFSIDYNFKSYPIGFVFKIIFINNYGDKNYISLKNIIFYDKNNVDLNHEVKYNKITFSNEENAIYSYQYLDYKKNENSICNNLLFICFEELVQVKYIKIINKKEKLSQNTKTIQIYCDDILIFEGNINQCNESIISFESDYNKIDKKIKKDKIIPLNSIDLKERNIYRKLKINNGYMLVLEKEP